MDSMALACSKFDYPDPAEANKRLLKAANNYVESSLNNNRF
jgi:hypothetical protein